MADETERSEKSASRSEERRRRTGHDAVIVDLGKRSKRDVDRLRKGRGILMDDVDDCLHELVVAGQIDASAEPVIIVIAEKPKKVRPLLVPPGLPLAFAANDDDDDDEDDDDEED